MAILLNIDCATDYASVCVSNNEKVIAFKDNPHQKEHASFLQAAIKDLTEQSGISLKDLNAISVSSGPGSYTGLRVGMASAKGLCYALNIPLVTINTLEVMAHAAIRESDPEIDFESALFCPMIDARRMEVFTALFNSRLELVIKPVAMVIEPGSFKDVPEDQKLIFFGSGSKKCEGILRSSNYTFKQIQHSAKNLAALAATSYQKNEFANLAYAEPFYLKDLFTLK